MFAALSIALAHQPVELGVLPGYRSARSRIASDGGSSDLGDGHYGVRFRVVGHLRPWMSVHLDATQSLLNLWFEPETRMQRHGRLRLTAGPRWEPFELRARVGVGEEGIVTLSGFQRLYRSQTVLESGLEASVSGSAMRLTAGVTVFGVPGRSGSTVDLELAIPNGSVVGGVASYGYRHLQGTWTFDTRTSEIDDRNHWVSAGVIVRPRVRSAAEQ